MSGRVMTAFVYLPGAGAVRAVPVTGNPAGAGRLGAIRTGDPRTTTRCPTAAVVALSSLTRG